MLMKGLGKGVLCLSSGFLLLTMASVWEYTLRAALPRELEEAAVVAAKKVEDEPKEVKGPQPIVPEVPKEVKFTEEPFQNVVANLKQQSNATVVQQMKQQFGYTLNELVTKANAAANDDIKKSYQSLISQYQQYQTIATELEFDKNIQSYTKNNKADPQTVADLNAFYPVTSEDILALEQDQKQTASTINDLQKEVAQKEAVEVQRKTGLIKAMTARLESAKSQIAKQVESSFNQRAQAYQDTLNQLHNYFPNTVRNQQILATMQRGFSQLNALQKEIDNNLFTGALYQNAARDLEGEGASSLVVSSYSAQSNKLLKLGMNQKALLQVQQGDLATTLRTLDQAEPIVPQVAVAELPGVPAVVRPPAGQQGFVAWLKAHPNTLAALIAVPLIGVAIALLVGVAITNNTNNQTRDIIVPAPITPAEPLAPPQPEPITPAEPVTPIEPLTPVEPASPTPPQPEPLTPPQPAPSPPAPLAPATNSIATLQSQGAALQSEMQALIAQDQAVGRNPTTDAQILNLDAKLRAINNQLQALGAAMITSPLSRTR